MCSMNGMLDSSARHLGGMIGRSNVRRGPHMLPLADLASNQASGCPSSGFLEPMAS